jgi:hypothetical protein
VAPRMLSHPKLHRFFDFDYDNDNDNDNAAFVFDLLLTR